MLQESNKKTLLDQFFYFLKYYKTTKTFKATLFYFYRYIKLALLSSNTGKTIQVNGYNMSLIPNDKGISFQPEGRSISSTADPMADRLTPPTPRSTRPTSGPALPQTPPAPGSARRGP